MSELNELDATNHLSEVWRFLSDVSWQSLVSPDSAANGRTVFLSRGLLQKHNIEPREKLSTLILAKVQLKLKYIHMYDISFYNNTLYICCVCRYIYHYIYQYLSCFSTDEEKYYSSFYVPNPQG